MDRYAVVSRGDNGEFRLEGEFSYASGALTFVWGAAQADSIDDTWIMEREASGGTRWYLHSVIGVQGGWGVVPIIAAQVAHWLSERGQQS